MKIIKCREKSFKNHDCYNKDHSICHLDFDIGTEEIEVLVKKCDPVRLSGKKNRPKFGPEQRPCFVVESLYRDMEMQSTRVCKHEKEKHKEVSTQSIQARNHVSTPSKWACKHTTTLSMWTRKHVKRAI